MPVKRSIIFHPILLAASQPFFLYAHNLGFLPFTAIVFPMIRAACLTGIIWWVAGKIVRDFEKTAFLISLFWIFYFPSRDLTRSEGVLLWTGLCLIYAAAAWMLGRTRRDLSYLTRWANTLVVCLVTFSLVEVGMFELERRLNSAPVRPDEEDQMLWAAASKAAARRPPVYYIILDGYGRQDILRAIYSYDNQPFLDELTRQGFYVAAESHSNYGQTLLSLASSLNMKYIQDHLNVERTSNNRVPLKEMIDQSRVFRFFKAQGYRLVAFSSGYYFTELSKEADLYVAPGSSLEDFQKALDHGQKLAVDFSKTAESIDFKLDFDLQRERLLQNFEFLEKMKEPQTPVFVMVHLILPHPPFLFDGNGNSKTPKENLRFRDASHLIGPGRMAREEYIDGYRDQVIFLNQKIQSVVHAILKRTSGNAIILLQADHGPGSHFNHRKLEASDLTERFSIFNAYYFPDRNYEGIGHSISPVNSFREVLNKYFGTRLKRLPDQSYYSVWKRPYDFTEVTSQVSAPPPS